MNTQKNRGLEILLNTPHHKPYKIDRTTKRIYTDNNQEIGQLYIDGNKEIYFEFFNNKNTKIHITEEVILALQKSAKFVVYHTKFLSISIYSKPKLLGAGEIDNGIHIIVLYYYFYCKH
jgi:hypothetical protein